MTEKYIVFKEGHAQNAGSDIELGLREEIHVAVVGIRELIEMLPILNDYGNNAKSGRHFPKGFVMDVDAGYARRLGRELLRKERETLMER